MNKETVHNTLLKACQDNNEELLETILPKNHKNICDDILLELIIDDSYNKCINILNNTKMKDYLRKKQNNIISGPIYKAVIEHDYQKFKLLYKNCSINFTNIFYESMKRVFLHEYEIYDSEAEFQRWQIFTYILQKGNYDWDELIDMLIDGYDCDCCDIEFNKIDIMKVIIDYYDDISYDRIVYDLCINIIQNKQRMSNLKLLDYLNNKCTWNEVLSIALQDDPDNYDYDFSMNKVVNFILNKCNGTINNIILTEIDDQEILSLLSNYNKQLEIVNDIKNTYDKIKDTIEIPDKFICPISKELMINPVVISNGKIYEKSQIEKWLIDKDTDPQTRDLLIHKEVCPVISVRQEIIKFLKIEN